MKTINLTKLSILLFSIFVLSACGGVNYNTDYLPPTSDTDAKEIFPEKIADLSREVAIMDIAEENFKGVKAVYGSGEIVIEVVRIVNDGIQEDYLEKYLYPKIDALSSHSRANINGKWAGSGHDSEYQLYAWQSEDWIFMIKAKKDLFMDVLENFDYISEY